MSIWSHIGDAFKAAFGHLGDWLAVIFRQGVKAELEALMPIAMAAVAKMATTDLSNDAKRSAAFGEILNQAKGAQLNVGVSLINFALELAVQNLKGAGG